MKKPVIRVFAWTLGSALAVLLALAIIVGTLLGTPGGNVWLLAHVPGLTLDAPQGTLLGDFAARRVQWQSGGDHVRIDGLRWQGLTLRWRHIGVARLQADAVDFEFTPSKTSTPAPTDLHLPLTLDADQIEIAKISQAGQPLIQNLRGALNLSNDQFTLTLQHAGWQTLEASGKAQLATSSPLALTAHLDLRGRQPAWQGALDLTGPLADLQAHAQLQAEGQHLQLEAGLTPFKSWPIKSLQAHAENFDVAALLPQAPHTALSGQAELLSSGMNQPMQLSLNLSNAAAGRWDQGRAPLRSLTLELSGTPEQPEQITLRSLHAELGGASAAAGSIDGIGHLQPGGSWQLDATLTGLRTAALDARLTPATLAGSLRLQASSPIPLALQAQIRSQAGPAAKLDLSAQLLPSAPGQHRIEVKQALLTLGTGHISMQGQARQSAHDWQVQAQIGADHFDPGLLFKGATWAQSTNALNLDAKLTLSGIDHGLPQGQGTLTLKPSRLVGVALSGTAKLNGQALQAQLDAAGNQVHADVQLNPVEAQVTVNAPTLAHLQPLLALLAPGHTLQGAVHGQAHWQAASHWQSSGDLQASDVIVDEKIRVAQAQAKWQLSDTPDAPLRLSLTLDKAEAQGQSLDHGQLDVQGSDQAQHLDLAAQAQGHALTLSLDGNFDMHERRWNAHILHLNAPDLLQADALDLSLLFGHDAQLQSASLAPGRLLLAGAGLRWSQLDWQASAHAGVPPAVHADLTLEPLALGPLLARWQPGLGWGGDLVVTGHARWQTSPQELANFSLERQSGDLTLLDDSGKHSLGLRQIDVGGQWHDGRWLLTSNLDGSDWGQLAAHAELSAPALVPAPDARVTGRLDAKLAELSSLGHWLPVGWRMAGTLSAGLSLDGRLNAPQLHGQLTGSDLAASNRLLGIDLGHGSLRLDLDGDQARLTQFEAHAGAGQISATGTARLGATPEAQLQIQADKLSFLQRVDRKLVVSGSATLALAANALDLDGKLKVDSGLFDFSRSDAPSLSNDVYVLRPGADAGPPEPEGPSKHRTHIALALDLGSDLQLRGHGFDSRLAGQLTLSQDKGGPQLKGTVRTVGGNYAAYGQKLEIDRGLIAFNGPYDNPRLDVLALRPNLDVQVGVIIDGTAQAPRVQLYSVPDMSDTDKLSWLLLGRASDGLGRADTALLQRAALALLSGDGESPSSKLFSQLGLDELSVRQSDDSTRDTVVSLGKQLSKAWYVGYERSLNATTGSWQLTYRLAQRLTLRAQTGDDNAIELIWQWRSRLPSAPASASAPSGQASAP